MNNEYFLDTRYDSRKSFGHKARVRILEDGTQELISYTTAVAEITPDGKAKVYDTYSATTLRHIKEFLKQNYFKAESKAQIENDYLV